jgi:hypothetical protein
VDTTVLLLILIGVICIVAAIIGASTAGTPWCSADEVVIGVTK